MNAFASNRIACLVIKSSHVCPQDPRRVSTERQHPPVPFEVAGLVLDAQFHQCSVFDDTLPVADGHMEIGSAVPLDQLRESMEDWFRRKGYLPKDSHLILAEH